MRTVSCGMWDLVPWPGTEPGSLRWDLTVLTTGPPGKSLGLAQCPQGPIMVSQMTGFSYFKWWIVYKYIYICIHTHTFIQTHYILYIAYIGYGLPWWLRQWRILLQCRRPGFDPWVGRSSGEGTHYPLQYSCLENSMDRRTWQAVVHGVAKSLTWPID